MSNIKIMVTDKTAIMAKEFYVKIPAMAVAETFTDEVLNKSYMDPAVLIAESVASKVKKLVFDDIKDQIESYEKQITSYGLDEVDYSKVDTNTLTDPDYYTLTQYGTKQFNIPLYSGTPPVVELLSQYFPGAMDQEVACPCGHGDCKFHHYLGKLSHVIVHLNDACAWSREQIADWIDTLDIDQYLKEIPNGNTSED